MLPSFIALLGFDPWLWCRSAQYNSGRCGGEVVLSPWSRLTPVSLAQSKLKSLQAASTVDLFGVTYSTRIPWYTQPSQLFLYCLLSLLVCPPGRETGGKIAGRNVKRLSVPFPVWRWGFSYWFFFYTIFVLNKSSLFASSAASWAGSRVSICLAEILWWNLLLLYLNTNLRDFFPSL